MSTWLFGAWLVAGQLGCAAFDPYGDKDAADTASETDGPGANGDYNPTVPDDTAFGSDTDTDTDDAGQGPIRIDLRNLGVTSPVGSPIGLVAWKITSANHPLGDLTISLSSNLDGDLVVPDYNAGKDLWEYIPDQLRAGEHTLTVLVEDPDGARARETVDVAVCEWPARDDIDFTTNPIGTTWRAYGDAYWDANGWLEVTGNYQGRAGHLYFIDDEIDPGSFRIDFSFATGGGINSGADGYAVNIVDARDLEDLEDYIDHTENGGCLGYGSSGNCNTRPVNAFHVELDTWQNSNNPVNDPTSADHLAITLDGNPSNHIVYTTFEMEDLVWRDVVVEGNSTWLVVRVDGEVKIQEDITGFQFDGGYIGISGSTGWATNFHRFDNLKTYGNCTVPR